MGVLSASVLNLSNTNRAARRQSWPLAIIEGPKGVSPTFFALKDVFEQMAELYDNGMLVDDGLTKRQITVHAALALVIADNPAPRKKDTKNGEHVGWIESQMLDREHLESDVIHKRNQHIIWKEVHSKNGWSKTKLGEWTDQFRSNGLSPLQLVTTLSLIDDMPTESMHFILKGFLQDLAK